jgi:hypothetical protein
MASVFDAFFDEIQALLELTYDCFKADAEAHPEDAVLRDLAMDVEYALSVFCRHRGSGWTRRPKEQVEFDMQHVEDVCAYVMGAIPVVPARHGESLEQLRVVIRAAQRRFRNVDKTVTVRLVDSTGGVRNEHPPTTHTINAEHTVQQVVRATYPAFPGACRRVVLRRRGLNLWDRTPHGCAFFSRDRYDTLRGGDEVDIEVETEKPDGPSFFQARLPERGAAGGGHSAHEPAVAAGAAAGIEAVCVGLELLRELKQSA